MGIFLYNLDKGWRSVAHTASYGKWCEKLECNCKKIKRKNGETMQIKMAQPSKPWYQQEKMDRIGRS